MSPNSSFSFRRCAAALGIVAIASMAARAVEIKVLAGSAVLPAMAQIVPAFEQRTGHHVVFDYGTVGGMAQRIQGGEAPRPDMGSVDAFKRSLLAAKSIGFNDPAAGAPVGIYLLRLFERLGIAEEMKPKTVVFKQRSERFDAVARGDVEIGFNQVSEILAVGAVDLVAPLPAPIQNYTVLAAGVVSKGREQDAAKSFIEFLSTRESAAVFAAKGFEAP